MNSRKLWSPKEDQAWVHDRFGEMDAHDIHGENVSVMASFVFMHASFLNKLFLQLCFQPKINQGGHFRGRGGGPGG